MDGTDGARGPFTHQLFEEQVARTPDRLAVVAGRRQVSYLELDAMANGIACRLAATGAAPRALVGVCMGRDERLIAAFLGVFKAGAGYVPLDPAYPAQRLSFMARDAGLAQVVTTRQYRDLVTTMGVTPILADEAGPADAPSGVTVPPDGAAYVMYTSGSTGRPKGVVIEHHNAANLVRWVVSTMDAAEMAGSLAGLSVCFDGSVFEIFPPLASGGTVIVAESVLELPTLAARDEVTTLIAPPSALRVLLRHGLPASVRTVHCGGEALNSALVQALFAQPGVLRVRNAYGPTEATTLSHCHDMDRASFVDNGEPPPIGRLVAGAYGLVLDPDGQPVADGEVGELWIAGPGLARGYLRRPELTAERFVADRAVPGGRRYRTGDLVRRVSEVFHYLGRIDDQVKIRGFRVELGEVEAALRGHPGVAGAVAAAPADADGVRTLLGYVEPAPGSAVTEEQLRDHLIQRLPAHLVPSRIGIVASIPIAPTGKADRSALPALAPVASLADVVAPRDDREARIAAVFADVLRVPAVGVDDDFFELGGHSIYAALAVARISDELGAAVPLGWLLTAPTVAGLAARIASGAGARPRPRRHAGLSVFPLTSMQWSMWQVLQHAPEGSNTAAFELRLTGLPGVAALQAALDAVVSRHQALRTVIVRRGERPVATVRPPAPVPLTVVDPSELADVGVEEIVSGAVQHVFNLSYEVPLMRATLIRTGPGAARLIIAVDHIAFDGYSVAVLAEDLAVGLAGAAAGVPDPVPEPALQVGDVAILQIELAQQPAVVAMREFWRAELAGASSPNLAGIPWEKWPEHGRRLVYRLDAGALARLDALQAACGVTRFTVFAAALGVLMREATGVPDNLLGAVAALRDRPGLGEVIGPLFDLIPVRLRVADRVSFRQLAAQVAAVRTRALANQDLGLMGIMQCVNPGGTGAADRPLLPVVLSMQPATVPVVVERGPVRIELAGEIDTGSATCDIMVLVNVTAEGVEIHVTYDVARFAPASADAFTRRLIRIIDAAAADPDLPVEAL